MRRDAHAITMRFVPESDRLERAAVLFAQLFTLFEQISHFLKRQESALRRQEKGEGSAG